MVVRLLKRLPYFHHYLTSCKECGIYFFTDPRNKGRNDLCCPFGCRAIHEKRQSNIRSKNYYQHPVGKVKKKELNRKRRKANVNKKDSETLKRPTQPTSEKPPKDDSELVSYLTNLLGPLEQRPVSDEEVAAFIKEVRQRGIERFDFYPYIGRKENKQPP